MSECVESIGDVGNNKGCNNGVLGIFGKDTSLLFFFLLLVIIFCNCGIFKKDSSELLFFFLLLVILFGGGTLFR